MASFNSNLEEKASKFSTKEDVEIVGRNLSEKITEFKIDIIKWTVYTGVFLGVIFILAVKFLH